MYYYVVRHLNRDIPYFSCYRSCAHDFRPPPPLPPLKLASRRSKSACVVHGTGPRVRSWRHPETNPDLRENDRCSSVPRRCEDQLSKRWREQGVGSRKLPCILLLLFLFMYDVRTYMLLGWSGAGEATPPLISHSLAQWWRGFATCARRQIPNA